MALDGNHQLTPRLLLITGSDPFPLASVAERDERSRQQNGSAVMPRYYFHIEDDRIEIDHIGVELPDLNAAREEAVSAAGQILRNGAAKVLWGGKPWRMWVTRSPFANEKPLFVLRFSAEE